MLGAPARQHARLCLAWQAGSCLWGYYAILFVQKVQTSTEKILPQNHSFNSDKTA